MMRKMAIGLLLLAVPTIAMAYSGGPPDGRTGAPGELTCFDGCHNSFPLNSGDGSFSIFGPAQFDGGQTYTITIEISDPGQNQWGFELTPLDIGTITITDPTNTQQSSSGGNTYVKQTLLGTYAATPDGPVSWSFDWTAPSNPPDSVIFYAAGNAADFDGSSTGDYIYTTSFTTTLIPVGIDDNPFAAMPSHLSMHNYPNPFNAQTTITYQLPVSGHVRLEVYNINGQLVELLIDRHEDPGEKAVTWNAANIPSGVYLYNLMAADQGIAKKMILIK